MNIYSGLLFLHGHITHVDLARQLAGGETAPSPPDGRSAASGATGTGEAAQPDATWRADPCANA
ncbi:hypothetical protein D3C87_1011310 [compost metagenome]